MKILLLIALLIFGCDTCNTINDIFAAKNIITGEADEEDIQELLEEADSGQWIGYSINECITIELHCAENNGVYEYGSPNNEFMCLCNW